MPKEELKLLRNRVTELRAEGKYKETIENCYNLIKKAMKLKDYKSLLTAYINLGASYYCIGDIELAFESLSKHSEYCDKYGDEEDILNSSNILALLYEYNKDYVSSKDTLKKAIDLGKKLRKYNIVSNAYSNYAHICMIEENYTEALEMAVIGLEIARLHKPASKILELRVRLNIGKALIGLNDFKNSKYIIDEIINDEILELFIREKSQVYHLKGYWYSKQKLYKEALEAYNVAKTLVESYNDIHLLQIIQEERCKLCDDMGNIDLGYKVQKEYITLLKEINNRELQSMALKLQVKHNMEEMRKKANMDFLTGLYNRSYIEVTANQWLKNDKIICIVFDVDKFKSFNDNYGHLFGDEVIKKVSRTCLNIIKKPDLVGRFGGDEFVILIKGNSKEKAISKAEQLLEGIRNLKIHDGNDVISITISIGISDNIDRIITDFKELFELADRGLYKAKKNGRNQICTYD